MNVLSLFDGMSCGQQALERAGIKVDKYFASEIDKYAIQVTMANYPNTIQLGSVVNVNGYDLPKIDLLIGGSPCQSFSFAGKRKGMSTKDEQEILTLEHYIQLKEEGFEFEGQSYLFWEYMRLLNEVKPKYFLLENVMMGEKWEKILSKAIGVKPIMINSSLVSAQNRQRLYWTNIGLEPSGLFGDLESIIQQPKDKKMLLKDILEEEVSQKYFLSDKLISWLEKHSLKRGNEFKKKTGEEKSCCLTSSGLSKTNLSSDYIITHNLQRRSADRPALKENKNAGGSGHLSKSDGKTYCLDVGNTQAIEILGCDYRIDEGLRVRKNGKSGTLAARARNDESCGQLAKIIKYDIPEIVSVRKYKVDIISLQNCLKKHKNLSNSEIAKKLNISKTLVEHWFRKDDSFAIPNKDIWFDLKKLLNINTNEFDKSITTFEEKESVFEKSNRVYDSNGLSPTLTCVGADERILFNSKIRRLTPLECERLQTVKDNYTNHVSDSQRYKMLGNGWTVDVIVHILNYIK